MIEQVSGFVARRLGVSLREFEAMILGEGEIVDEGVRAFAEVTTGVLEWLRKNVEIIHYHKTVVTEAIPASSEIATVKESSNSFQLFRQNKILILEPILTPSAIVAVAQDSENHQSIVLEPILTPVEDYAAEVSLDTPSNPNSLPSKAEKSEVSSGVFTVGESGKVSFDYLFDGGPYSGEVAIFSLENINAEPGSQEFIEEAARRSLSNSELGHVVISDASKTMDSGRDNLQKTVFSTGRYYRSEKTFDMKAKTNFGFMFVPSQSIQDVVDGKAVKKTLFSIPIMNQDETYKFGQISAVTDDSATFVFEDLTITERSDGDYNDIVFQVRGATGEAPLLDADNQQWHLIDDDVGQSWIEYVAGDQISIGIIDDGFTIEANLDMSSAYSDNDLSQIMHGGNENMALANSTSTDHWIFSLIEFVDGVRESGQSRAVVQVDIGKRNSTYYGSS